MILHYIFFYSSIFINENSNNKKKTTRTIIIVYRRYNGFGYNYQYLYDASFIQDEAYNIKVSSTSTNGQGNSMYAKLTL
jgi:hypothetical protein